MSGKEPLEFSSNEPLEVCEIEMIGCEKNSFGDGCTSCTLPENCEDCDVLTGSCYRCLSNLTGPNCLQENDNIILRNIPAIMFASYHTDTTSYSVDPFLLTDGLLNKSNCQSFAEVHVPTVVRIFVNTLKYYSIKKIKFHMLFDNIPDAGNIILQFAVNDYKSIWHGNFSFSEDGIYSLPYVKNAHALDINIAFAYTNVSSSTKAYVCELEVNGCPSGFYGTPCKKCKISACTFPRCDPSDGSCVCAASYPDSFCPQGALCRHGLYGKYCDQNCSSHCNTSFECHQGNGTCIGGCQDGWGSDKCDKGMQSTDFKIN